MDDINEKYEIALQALWHYGKPSNWQRSHDGRHRYYGFTTQDQDPPEGFEIARKALNDIWKLEQLKHSPKMIPIQDESTLTM